ncbi:methyltransferase [Synechocystis sp. PCC 7509]|uniref:methyltransferase n=1 Tax=Synechocystis sp. PCC 7509 TaxID=927677 RepID=UPI0002AC8A34|nr:methyltransferase [Synechocystis sp. PCC 7509]
MLTSPKPLKDVFFCPEESNFYSYCLQSLVLNNCLSSETIIEFGSGDGSPVINSLSKLKFDGVVHGFEINKLSCELANERIKVYGLSDKYIVHNRSLFDTTKPQGDYLISNPPYLPAIDNKIYQPFLHGGTDGITVTKQLLSLDYKNVLAMIASYSNPVGAIDYALTKGYHIANFIISPLNFGYYSSELKVKNRIEELKQEQKAFYSKNMYLLAGVLFTKQSDRQANLSTELVQLMTCL